MGTDGESKERDSGDGDGRGRGDGDGRSYGREMHLGEGTFVFGSTGGGQNKKSSQDTGSVRVVRRSISLSYKEKLLSPGGLGYLVSHAEEDDIVSGWKGFFARKNAETEAESGVEKTVREDDIGDSLMSRYPVLSVTSEQYTAWCRPWMNSLIIKVLGLSISRHVLIDRVRRMWKPQQPLKVVPLSNEYYIVSFSSIEDRDYAFYEGPWMIDDHYLLVQRWRPNFNPWKADCQRRIAVWVRIPDLPMEFCTVESLGMIGNMIGKIIKIDRSTSIYDKGEFARICVEVDLQKPLLPAFTAFGEDKQLVYEGLHLVCFGCGCYGHERVECPHRKEGESAHVTEDATGNSGNQKQSMEAAGVVCKSDEQSSDKEQGIGEPTVVKVATGSVRGKKEKHLTSDNGFSDGCEHLGPQMILRRDLRKGIQSFGRRGGVKNEGTMIMQGGRKVENNMKGSRESDFLNESREKLVGLPKTKTEWVVVGSKRKKEEKALIFGKANRSGGKHRIKQNQVIKCGPHNIKLSNAFSSLRELSPSCMNSIQQVNSGPYHMDLNNDYSPFHELPRESIKGGLSLYGNLHNHTNNAISIQGEATDVLVDVTMGLDGTDDEVGKKDMLRGSGLAPSTSQMS